MKKNKGFTLVELLAVIVILAIIMIIAIPAVLQTMQSARQKTFKEYVTKVYSAGQNAYLSKQTLGTNNGTTPIEVSFKESGDAAGLNRKCTAFDIQTGLGLSSTGSYKGAVIVCPGTSVGDETKIYVGLKDDNYSTKGYIEYKGEDSINLGTADEFSYTTITSSTPGLTEKTNS